MKIKIKLFQCPVGLAFLVSILYWIYLALTTQMSIIFDAAEYESLGKILAQKGWVEFFMTGPHREPFYPALIAFSMKLGNFLGVSYKPIQVSMQLLILFLTQILALRILRLLRINNLLSALTILYLGISPAIVNSALSLFSEIGAYPFILLIMFLAYRSWLSFPGPRPRVIILAIVTSLLLVFMVLNKGIFELVTPIFIFLFIVSAIFTRNRKLIVNALIYLVVFLIIFYPLVNGYKMINKIFNNRFTVTDRGAWVLYGNTVIRVGPVNSERLITTLASVCGEGVCKSVLGETKCRYWSCWNSDGIGQEKLNELNKGNMPQDEIYNTLVKLSKQKVLQNPVRYFIFTSIEGLKMFFWESTLIGFVAYPEGLRKLFYWTLFKDGLRLAISVLTFLSIAYLVVLILRERRGFLKKEGPLLFLYLSLLFIFSFVSSYAIFCIITRYFLPIASLYLIIIAYCFQEIFFRAPNSK